MSKEVQKIVLMFLFLLLTSCATIFSKKTYKIDIKSANNSKVKVYDSIYDLPARIEVERSKKDLPIFLIRQDSIQKVYVLKSTLREGFLYGNLSFYLFAPAGYLVDLTNQKRFYYGNSIYLNSDGTITKGKSPLSKAYFDVKGNLTNYFSKEYPTRKDQIFLTLSIPWINNFNFQLNGLGNKSSLGFLGVSAGLEYYHSDRRYISLNASAVYDFIAPVPAPVSQDGEYESFSALSLSLSENYKIKRFTFGYGFNFSKNSWKFSNTDYDSTIPNSKEPVLKSNYGIGLIGNTYFQFSKGFFVGLNYKPTFYTFKPDSKFLYEHIISLDLLWKIRLKNKI